MRKVTSLQLPLRRVVPLAIIVVGLIVTSALVIQQVSAQASRTLKPPFKLIQTDKTGPRLSLPPLPLNAPVLISETFGTGFNPSPTLTGNGWHTVNLSGTLQGYSWGRVFNSGIMTDTAWIAQERFPGSLPEIKAGTPYTTNMNALLIYGPINLSDYGAIVASATYFLDVQTEDSYGLAYSLDGTNFVAVSNEVGRDPTLGSQRTAYYNLPGVAKQSTVWLAFYFTSTNHPIDALGVFLDEVIVRGVPLSKNYMPVVLNGYPPATPTPTPTLTPTPTATPTATPQVAYRYQYTFTSESNGNNPDFNRWGGDRKTSCGTNCDYDQALGQGLGNPGNSFKLWLQGVNGFGGSAPRQNGASLATATNFEYSADLFVYNGQLDASYGLVFAATQSTFPDSGDPWFAPQYNYYTLELRVSPSDRTKITQWQFVRVKNGGRSGVGNLANLPSTLTQGQWHNVKVTLQGTTLMFYLNNQYIGSGSTDADWNTDRRRFGLYIQTRASNGAGGPFEFFSDNITVRDLP
jgi:hypothetical protein